MKVRRIHAWMVPLALAVVLAAEGKSQSGQGEYTLNVNGQSGSAKVVQINGHSFVDVDALARIANGSIAYQGNQIMLSLPGGGAAAQSAPAQAASSPPPPNLGFSKEFVTAGIEFMSEIREWRNTLANAIANGFPLSDDLFAPYRGQAATSLRLAKVAASTQGDQSAAQLLGNEFNNMNNLTKKYLAKRANLDFISPDALNNDGMYQNVLTCARALAAMGSANLFSDDGSCH
jgi:hypothetical protein